MLANSRAAAQEVARVLPRVIRSTRVAATRLTAVNVSKAVASEPVSVRCFSSKAKPSCAGKKEFVSCLDKLADVKEPINVTCSYAAQGRKPALECIDGCEAAAHIAYGASDSAFIYPITPSSPMAELADAWAAAGRKNAYGNVLDITVMQSEGGAAGAVHGALAAGSFTTTFTASQGLMLMIPNMFKIAGELIPCVFHVAARALASEALSIFGDHQDVMAARNTGFALLSSHSVQESMDLALVSHLATLKASVPFCHFFDGFRTSHEINKVDVIPYKVLSDFFEKPEYVEAIRKAKARALNPNHPKLRGSSQGPDVYFQAIEGANKYYEATPAIVQECMNEVAAVTGRQYHLFDYIGHPQATRVLIMMGAGCPVAEEMVAHINKTEKEKVGLIKVHLFRPWSTDHLLAAIPASAKKIAVLDRTKEPGSNGEPLYLDVCASFHKAAQRGLIKRNHEVSIVGGRYGLGSKEFTPAMAKAVFDNLKAKHPMNQFSVGINDDVTYKSLPIGPAIHTVPEKTVECLFWGLGSDGTVGANKEAITIIGENTNLNAQGYFSYDAHKSGGVTVSHLRFGPQPITSSYLIQEADYIGCHMSSYVNKYNVVGNLKKNGVFVLNTTSSAEEVAQELPAAVKRQLAKQNAKFYIIDARKIAESVGLGKRINMIMQVCFFALAKVMPLEQSLSLLKKAIEKTYGKKGKEIVEQNIAACDKAVAGLVEMQVPAEWANAEDKATEGAQKLPEWVEKIMMPMQRLEGDKLPVSMFTGESAGGVQPMGLTKYERRYISTQAPVWNMEKCTQCNYCAMVCPHAVIRPFLQTEEDEQRDIASGKAPKTYKTIKCKGGAEAEGLRYSIQITPADCTGCGLCTRYCRDEALEMRPIKEHMEAQQANWDYAVNLPNYGDRFDRTTLRGVQFQQPLLEFSGACDGCGETPYVKLITQLFGHRLQIANATGCSSIWGGTYASNPYTVRQDGKGVAWGNSLFEDNAEYGLGMFKASRAMRANQARRVAEALKANVPMSEALNLCLTQWREIYDKSGKADEACKLADKIVPLLEAEKGNDKKLQQLYDNKDAFMVQSQWIIGGDGWAYDIGYGGLDHVLASGEKVNIMVLDTETYSNTGGQKSKSTPLGAVCKFAAGGNRKSKKDLGQMAMSYGNVYVASVAMGADLQQCLKAMIEAEAYPGTSIITAFAPCQLHGNSLFLTSNRDKMAVDSGYWSLYRYNPSLLDEGKNPFQLDSKKLRVDLAEFLAKDLRYKQLQNANPAVAKDLNKHMKEMYLHRFQAFKRKSEENPNGGATESASLDKLGMLVLYGSETGTSKALAERLAAEAKARGLTAMASAMDDFEFEALATINCPTTFILSTCGQGKMPANATEMYKYLSKQKKGALANMKFSVFGLGDSNYAYFCKAAADLEAKLEELGAKKLVRRGSGNDQDVDKFETGWEEWAPEMWTELKVPPPPMPAGPAEAPYTVTLSAPAKTEAIIPAGSQPIEVAVNKKVEPADYDRALYHLEFDIKGKNLKYQMGDCLALFGKNDPKMVADFCAFYGLDAAQVANVAPVKGHELKAGLPKQAMTVQQVFEDVLDIFGRPTRRFYKELALFATNAEEKAALVNIGENKAEYMKMAAESVTYADILQQFPSAKPSLAHLLHMLPIIKPRYYSIASSSAMFPDTIHLWIVAADWKTPAGKDRKGLTTSYIERLNAAGAPQTMNVALRRSAIEVPKSHKSPVIMCGLGTGVATFRAMVQERSFVKKQGKETGPMVLYYGTRYHKKDFLYAQEFEQYQQEGVLCEGGLRPACDADDGAKPKYVSGYMAEDSKQIADLLLNQEGYFYYCGPAGVVPKVVRQCIEAAFVKEAGMTKQEAEKTITDLIIKGRYNVEAWS